jgi:hypothetical protein
MERIQGVGDREAGFLTRLIYRVFRKNLGSVPKSKRLAAYHTPTLLASTWMDVVNASARTVPAPLKEIGQLKAALIAGCPF